MKSVLVSIIAIVSGFLAIAGSESLNVGASLPIAGQTYYLAGSGMSSSATSFTLTSFTIPQSGALINDSQISDTFYLTIEPGSRTRQEIVSCTTVTQNADTTATISGCTRGLSPMTPFTASTSLQFSHAGGASVILSNPPQLYETVGFLDNDEAITGAWTAITPVSATGIANKAYVDSVVNGGAITLDNISLGATAGDTFATGTIVYFDTGTMRWEKADANVVASSTGVLLGIAQGAGTDGSTISGGVLTRGYDETQIGMTGGDTIYLSDTAGATSTSAGTNPIKLGIARSATVLYFDPTQLNQAFVNATNTFTGVNTFNEKITGHASTTYTVYTASTTWTKPDNFEYIIVEVVGAGGDGGSGSDTDASNFHGSGGGGGGYAKELLTASDLSATTSVKIAVGANSGTKTSSFSTFLSATGGSDGGTAANGGAGGVGLGGDLNVGGEDGESSQSDSGASGGSSVYGGGGRGGYDNAAGADGNNYGAGGGGGGGDASSGKAGGSGVNGVVIVTVYY